MNMNLNLDLKNLKINPAQILHWLSKIRALLIGLVLIGAFGYTAYVVNKAVNVTADPTVAKPVGISFDKATLDSLKTINSAQSTVAPTTLGKQDPFGTN